MGHQEPGMGRSLTVTNSQRTKAVAKRGRTNITKERARALPAAQQELYTVLAHVVANHTSACCCQPHGMPTAHLVNPPCLPAVQSPTPYNQLCHMLLRTTRHAHCPLSKPTMPARSSIPNTLHSTHSAHLGGLRGTSHRAPFLRGTCITHCRNVTQAIKPSSHPPMKR